MENISNLLKMPSTKKTNSERSELIKFWCDNVLNKKGNKYPPAFIAMKMSGYSIKDLYYLQSVAKDYVNRGGDVGKYWWSLFKIK
jgi:hypothetical protein